jgi:hypothetical protein
MTTDPYAETDDWIVPATRPHGDAQPVSAPEPSGGSTPEAGEAARVARYAERAFLTTYWNDRTPEVVQVVTVEDAVAVADQETAELRAEVEALPQMARDFSLWLNGTYPPDLDTEALHWRRVSKVSEEAGEVREALGAWFGENPRKDRGTVDDVIKELADCVGAALGAIEHLTGHEGRSLDIATERVRFVCERVGVRPAIASVGVSGSADDRREANASQAPDTATPGEATCPTCGKTREDTTPGPHREGWGVCPESFHFRAASSADDKAGE